MPIDIDALTESELIDLNHRIVARLRFLRQLDAHATMLEFRIGERVTFHPDGRPPLTGMITRYNKKTVSIVTDDGQRCNVAPHFLECAAPCATGKPATAGRINGVAKRPCRRTTLSGEERPVRLGPAKSAFIHLGLEQVPISVNISPSPAMRSSSQTDLFVEKDVAF
jgi:hypothetical protein